MPDPTLYLFDGWNLLHAGSFKEPTELIDRLASFVGTTGARGDPNTDHSVRGRRYRIFSDQCPLAISGESFTDGLRNHG